MSSEVLNSLLDTVRGSGFAHGVVRVGGVHLEFGRAATVRVPVTEPAATEPQPGATLPPSPVLVRAEAPGTVSLRVAVGASVEPGEELGHLQVHRKRVAITAPAPGTVTDIHLADGSFAAYGDVICALSGRA
jgi:biotin carboxyl carrier protein